jgi:catechol 2,3-dioxygenase-like lactoylglutathione lyase family enzyme
LQGDYAILGGDPHGNRQTAKFSGRAPFETRRHEWRRGTHECVRHILRDPSYDARIGLGKGAEVMIFGAHVVVYSEDAAADRAFLREVLGLSSVDAGHGWLIFALPPAELAVHPSEGEVRHELYFMCDDLKAEIAVLAEKGVHCSEVQEARWGSITHIKLPGGGEAGLYQPKHPIALTRTSNGPSNS